MKRILLLLLLLCGVLSLLGCAREKEDLLAYQDGDFAFTGRFMLDGMECKASFTQTVKDGEVVRTMTYTEPEPLSGFSFRSQGGKIYASYGEDTVELSDAEAAMRVFSLFDIPKDAKLAGASAADGRTEVIYSTDAGSYTLTFAEGDPFPICIVFTGREFGISLSVEK